MEQISVDTVTHVYFCAYIQDSDPPKEAQLNSALLGRSILAVEKLAENLEFILLPIGTNVISILLVF